MSDQDGDTHMNVPSSSDDDNSDNMFPGGDDNANTMQMLREETTELSPPHSQDPGSFDGDDAMETAATDGSYMQDFYEGNGEEAEGSSNAKPPFVPGATWNNEKAKDEYEKAYNLLQDKKFSLKRFGDPFDDSKQDGKR